MDFNYYDLGELHGGEVAEITLLGNAANVKLLDAENYLLYKAAKEHTFLGGLAKRNTTKLQVPNAGHWFVTVDMHGLLGSTKSIVKVTEDPGTPIEPFDSIQPVPYKPPVPKPVIEKAEPVDMQVHDQPVQAVEPVQVAEPVQAVEPVQVAEPMEAVQSVEFIEPAEPVEKTEAAFAESIEYAKPVDTTGLSADEEYAKPVDAAGLADDEYEEPVEYSDFVENTDAEFAESIDAGDHTDVAEYAADTNEPVAEYNPDDSESVEFTDYTETDADAYVEGSTDDYTKLSEETEASDLLESSVEFNQEHDIIDLPSDDENQNENNF